jgi:hypothetical protein
VSIGNQLLEHRNPLRQQPFWKVMPMLAPLKRYWQERQESNNSLVNREESEE